MRDIQSKSIKVWIALLTFLAGFLNAGFVIRAGITVSHHTGNITRLTMSLSRGVFGESAILFLLLAAFFFGACISGFIFYDRNFELSNRYGIMLLLFSLVFFAAGAVHLSLPVAAAVTCGVLGMQNGMFIFYKGVLIRTSHFSGYLTDAGLTLGMVLRGKKEAFARCLSYLSSIIYFALGTVLAIHIPETAAFFVASALYGTTGIFYFTVRKRLTKHL